MEHLGPSLGMFQASNPNSKATDLCDSWHTMGIHAISEAQLKWFFNTEVWTTLPVLGRRHLTSVSWDLIRSERNDRSKAPRVTGTPGCGGPRHCNWKAGNMPWTVAKSCNPSLLVKMVKFRSSYFGCEAIFQWPSLESGTSTAGPGYGLGASALILA